MADSPVQLDVEPWLRGPLAGVHPLVAPTLYAYAQAREDAERWTRGLTDAQMWLRPGAIASVAFHLRHIAGSVERLTAYLEGRQLTPQQLEAIRREGEPESESRLGRAALLYDFNQALQESEQVILALDPATLSHPRSVGRKQLPTTVIGLVVHLAEHTQRHLGELIVTSKVVRKSDWAY
jgi:hypothetical protein